MLNGRRRHQFCAVIPFVHHYYSQSLGATLIYVSFTTDMDQTLRDTIARMPAGSLLLYSSLSPFLEHGSCNCSVSLLKHSGLPVEYFFLA